MRPVPQQAVALVTQWEGKRLKAYPDPATGDAPWTIGYGHTRGVRPGQLINEGQALTFLRADLADAARLLESRIGPVVAELTDNQYAALLSLIFNVGAGESWAIWKRLKARQFDQVPTEILRFVNAGGKKLQGLVNRRAAEAALFTAGEPGIHYETPPSGAMRLMDTPPTPLAAKPLSRSRRLWLGLVAAVTGAGNWASDHLKVVGDLAHQLQQMIAPQISYSDFLAKLSGGLAVVTVAAGAAVMFLQAKAHKDGGS